MCMWEWFKNMTVVTIGYQWSPSEDSVVKLIVMVTF